MKKVKKTIRIEKKLKNSAVEVLDSVNYTISKAITLLFQKIIEVKGVPFDVKIDDGEVSVEVSPEDGRIDFTIDKDLCKNGEIILNDLKIPVSVMVAVFLRQVILKRKLPFEVERITLEERLERGENPIKVYREEAGISVTELAEECGVSRSYIYDIENGESIIKDLNLKKKIKEILKMPKGLI